ncbi:MAG: hypothetical protein R3286_06210 [Gammaproteobacteria bacterium]|nr:hypothetical protein [Gammaproteobacteria bacterium]
MKSVLRYVPGLAGALVAFAVLKLSGWMDFGLELGAFLAAYLIITLAIDHAMRHYGRD